MATQNQIIQRIIRHFLEEKGVQEYQMDDVIQYAIGKGYRVPPPISGLDRLHKKFARAAAEEIRYDDATGKPYRANHARLTVRDGKQIPLWFDIDNITRPVMQKYAFQRREHLVGEGVQLSLDLDHWNRVHPKEEPVAVPMDLTDDIEWRKNAPDEEQEAG